MSDPTPAAPPRAAPPPAAPVPAAIDIAVAAAPAGTRAALDAIFTLDGTLAQVVRSTREPLVGQMRLAWWRDALTRLDRAAAPAEPVLQAVQAGVLPCGATGTALARMTEGWEDLLLADPLDEPVLLRFAESRGAALFTAAGQALGGGSPALGDAGRAWALADLALHVSDPAAASLSTNLAQPFFSKAFSTRWPKVLRPVGLLALLARLDLADGSPAAKVLQVSRFRIFGR